MVITTGRSRDCGCAESLVSLVPIFASANLRCSTCERLSRFGYAWGVEDSRAAAAVVFHFNLHENETALFPLGVLFQLFHLLCFDRLAPASSPATSNAHKHRLERSALTGRDKRGKAPFITWKVENRRFLLYIHAQQPPPSKVDQGV